MWVKQPSELWLLVLLALFCFALGLSSAHGQETSLIETESLTESTTPSLLSNYSTSELWSLFYTTLTVLKEQSSADRLALTSYVENATQREQNLTNIIGTLNSELTSVMQALVLSKQSVESLSDAGQAAINEAKKWRTYAYIAGGVCVLSTGGIIVAVILEYNKK